MLGQRRHQMSKSPASARTVGDADAASLLKSLSRVDECIALDEYVVAHGPVNAVGYFKVLCQAQERWSTHAVRVSGC